MLGIVWAHTDAFPIGAEPLTFLKNLNHPEYFIAFKQIFKFSVICFFMISGFLLGDNMDHTRPVSYFKRRVSKTLRSYLLSFFVFMILLLCFNYIINHQVISIVHFPRFAYNILFYTPYWFMPTYYIGLMTMLLFSRYINSIGFGMILLAVTLFYTFSSFFIENKIYDHKTALFAFVFYIWLGGFIKKRMLVDKIKKIKVVWLIIAVSLTYVLACYQSFKLFEAGNQFFYNNLRIFNQLYGLAAFLLLIKICPEKPNFWKLNPRKETFGIYLYHFYFVAFIFPLILMFSQKFLGFHLSDQPVGIIIISSLVHFILAYVTALAFVRLCIKRNWNII